MNGETDYERRMSDVKRIELGEKIGYKKGFEAARKQFERPHGEWLFDGWGTCCSECGYRPKIGGGKFCSECGADMSKEGGEK